MPPRPKAKKGLIRRIRSLTAPKDRDELLELLRDAHGAGLLDADGFAMLEGALQVSEQQVRDIMVPRHQMISVRRNDPASRVVQTVVESGHSRFPVMEADRDDICGVLLAKDLIAVTLASVPRPFDLQALMRPVVFVPESKRVNVLLKELRLNRNHMAVVVDEYGGVAGLITIEDVIEQIVGDIDDEFDVAGETPIRAEGDGARQFSVRGSTPVEDFNEFFRAELSDQDADTVAGVVVQQFGRMPRRGESISIHGFEFRIVRADRRRIDALRVIVPEQPAAESPGAGDEDTAGDGSGTS